MRPPSQLTRRDPRASSSESLTQRTTDDFIVCRPQTGRRLAPSSEGLGPTPFDASIECDDYVVDPQRYATGVALKLRFYICLVPAGREKTTFLCHLRRFAPTSRLGLLALEVFYRGVLPRWPPGGKKTEFLFHLWVVQKLCFRATSAPQVARKHRFRATERLNRNGQSGRRATGWGYRR